MAQIISKQQAINLIKDHIKGCKKSKKKYLKEKSYYAAADMKSRIDGLELALNYIQQIKDDLD